MRFSLNKIGSPTHRIRVMDCNHLLPLELLRAGEWADVAEVSGEPGWVCRMAELGVREGSRVQMVQGGCPCLLQVGGCRLSLRGECHMQILVRPVVH